MPAPTPTPTPTPAPVAAGATQLRFDDYSTSQKQNILNALAALGYDVTQITVSRINSILNSNLGQTVLSMAASGSYPSMPAGNVPVPQAGVPVTTEPNVYTGDVTPTGMQYSAPAATVGLPTPPQAMGGDVEYRTVDGHKMWRHSGTNERWQTTEPPWGWPADIPSDSSAAATAGAEEHTPGELFIWNGMVFQWRKNVLDQWEPVYITDLPAGQQDVSDYQKEIDEWNKWWAQEQLRLEQAQAQKLQDEQIAYQKEQARLAQIAKNKEYLAGLISDPREWIQASMYNYLLGLGEDQNLGAGWYQQAMAQPSTLQAALPQTPSWLANTVYEGRGGSALANVADLRNAGTLPALSKEDYMAMPASRRSMLYGLSDFLGVPAEDYVQQFPFLNAEEAPKATRLTPAIQY